MLASIAITILAITGSVIATPVDEPGTTSTHLDKRDSPSKNGVVGGVAPLAVRAEGADKTGAGTTFSDGGGGSSKPRVKRQGEPLIDEQEALFPSGADPIKYTGAITWAPLISKTWITEGTLNVESIAAYSGRMMIHSETNLIVGSPEAVKRWWSNVPGSGPCDAKFCDAAGYYTFPCSSPPSVSFTFGEREFPFSPADFNLGPTGSTGATCLGAVVGVEGAPKDAWVIGDKFVKNIYTIYDEANSRVGFATLA